jgi:hypothetical protein
LAPEISLLGKIFKKIKKPYWGGGKMVVKNNGWYWVLREGSLTPIKRYEEYRDALDHDEGRVWTPPTWARGKNFFEAVEMAAKKDGLRETTRNGWWDSISPALKTPEREKVLRRVYEFILNPSKFEGYKKIIPLLREGGALKDWLPALEEVLVRLPRWEAMKGVFPEREYRRNEFPPVGNPNWRAENGFDEVLDFVKKAL